MHRQSVLPSMFCSCTFPSGKSYPAPSTVPYCSCCCQQIQIANEKKIDQVNNQYEWNLKTNNTWNPRRGAMQLKNYLKKNDRPAGLNLPFRIANFFVSLVYEHFRHPFHSL